MLWMLQCAPGIPTDAPFTVADLGAGTCAACVGARLALHEHAGAEQNLRVFPIDVASSSERFVEAFHAMTRGVELGKAAVLPQQAPSQYLVSDRPGIDPMARSLFAQLSDRGEHPHVLLASFCLQYLRADERDGFFRHLGALAKRPFLLLIIKSVGASQRPSEVPSVLFATHYVVGSERNPRVIEAHLCLIQPSPVQTSESLPSSHMQQDPSPPSSSRPAECTTPPGLDPVSPSTLPAMASAVAAPYPKITSVMPSDQWAVQTFLAVERRCRREGAWAGSTWLDDALVSEAGGVGHQGSVARPRAAPPGATSLEQAGR